MRSILRGLACSLLVCGFGGLAPGEIVAGTIDGVTLFGNELVSIDTTTGIGTLIGPLGTSFSPFGLTNVDGSLYSFNSASSVIARLDPATGATLATYDVGIGPVLGQGGLAFQNRNVGYLTSALDPTTLDPVNNLYRFDLSTGKSVLIAHTAAALEAIAFSPTGTLYGLGKLDGNLYRIDPTSGAMTVVGNVGVDIGSPTGGLTFGPGGMLFASLDDKLYTLSTTTGAAMAVGSADPSLGVGFSTISGLAFAPAAVPEPSSLALLGTAACVVIGVSARRRWW